MDAHHSPVRRQGRTVTLTVHITPHSGTVTVLAREAKRTERLRVASSHDGAITFTAKLPPGIWTLVLTCRPAPGYNGPKPARIKVTIPRAAR